MTPRHWLLSAAAGVLAGCASVPADDAIGVAREWSQRVDGVAPALAADEAERRALRARLLAAPLDEAAAVRLALGASAAMQALLADAWQAQAAAAQAGAAPNPWFAFERITSGGEVDLTRTLGIGLTELLTLPARRDAAQRTVQARQWLLARDVLAHTAAMRESGGGEKGRGFEIELPLPVFDTGSARRQAASAQVLAARARLEQARSEATSLLRERYVAYRTAHDLARHYRDVVVPLARTVTDEMLLKYNGMLVGVFELLADARAQVHAVIGAIEAQRDFWLAHAALDAAIVGTPVAGVAVAAPTAAKAAAKGDH